MREREREGDKEREKGQERKGVYEQLEEIRETGKREIESRGECKETMRKGEGMGKEQTNARKKGGGKDRLGLGKEMGP